MLYDVVVTNKEVCSRTGCVTLRGKWRHVRLNTKNTESYGALPSATADSLCHRDPILLPVSHSSPGFAEGLLLITSLVLTEAVNSPATWVVLVTLEEPCKTLSHLVFIDLVFKPCGLLLLWLFMWRNGGTNNIKLIWIQDLIWPVTLSPMFLLDLSWITTNEHSRSRRKAVISR